MHLFKQPLGDNAQMIHNARKQLTNATRLLQYENIDKARALLDSELSKREARKRMNTDSRTLHQVWRTKNRKVLKKFVLVKDAKVNGYVKKREIKPGSTIGRLYMLV